MARASNSTPAGVDEAATAAKNSIEPVVLARLYGFYDEAGKLWQWAEGEVVKEVEHIKLLIERKAPLVGITHDEK